MSKRLVAIVMLMAFPAFAQVATVVPEDAPVILQVLDGEITTLDANDQPVKAGVGQGFYINRSAAKDITAGMAAASKELNDKTNKVNDLNKKVADLEAQRLTPGVLILIIGGAFLLGAGTAGAVVGVAMAKK